MEATDDKDEKQKGTNKQKDQDNNSDTTRLVILPKTNRIE